MLWLQDFASSTMSKLNQLTAPRIVKLENGEWYVIWRSRNPDGSTVRYRYKNGLNRIKDLQLREQWANKICQFINEAALEGNIPTQKFVEECFTPSAVLKPPQITPSVLVNFEAFYEESLEEHKNLVEPGTTRHRRNVLNNCRKFATEVLKKPCLEWTDFDAKFPVKILNWMYAKPRSFSQNTAAKFFATLRTVLLSADACGHLTEKTYKSKNYKLSDIETDAIALTFKEVQYIANFDMSDAPDRLLRVRDAFVLACLAGFRFSDLSKLKLSNFKKLPDEDGILVDVIEVLQQKTRRKPGAKVVVPLHPITARIIAANGGQLQRVCTNQKMNTYLKELGELMGFTDSVEMRENIAGKTVMVKMRKCDAMTTHTARRTFATIAFTEWLMPAWMVMQATGHKTERDFLRYVKVSKDQAAVKMSKYFKE